MSSLDLTFIVNEPQKSLKDRFVQLVKDCRYFDCLVGYFNITGFHQIYESLTSTEKIRILIGISTSKKTFDTIRSAFLEPKENEIHSSYEVKQITNSILEEEMAESEDNKDVEIGVRKFIEWIRGNKLSIKAYPSPHSVHAKLYIMTFKEGDRDTGRVITGSSNFTYAGLVDNLEFNVELKNRSDYEFAQEKFNELWEKAVDVSKEYVQTINEKSWLSENITPYDLYLKFLYEYFKDELSFTDEIYSKYLPSNFKKFEYQEQAVLNAKKIIERYGGVFISDVVGLGKTYIATMLAGQLGGRTIVIASPALLNKNNPGSWPNAFSDFNIPAEFISIGKLDSLLHKELDKYENIIIDEAHRFRTDTTKTYEKISEICRGKKVILISATPYNNLPADILSQIKLFQNPRKSTIPGNEDLEGFFKKLNDKLNNSKINSNYDEYLETAREIAKEIRDKILKYIMIRRTRSEIKKYFADDLKRNHVKFPEVEDPKPFYYQLNKLEEEIFDETVFLLTKKFKYARYTPLLYLKKSIGQLDRQAQKNMSGFMKVLLIKRLESSFCAFRKSIDRFIHSYEMFISEYEKGKVYISKKHIHKIFELLEEGNDEEIQKFIDEQKAEIYRSSDFKGNFIEDLQNDLEILKKIKERWSSIERDPKLESLLENLQENSILENKKIIIFTESKDTAEYIGKKINNVIGKTIIFHSGSSENVRDEIIYNFDAKSAYQKDDYNILVTTEVLSEGVNLHRSNIVINYDIPWNPTKLMQRIGRVNRIDTPFDKIYTFNFFPTAKTDSEIDLTKIARSKIETFFTLLGGDSSILTEGEPISSHELFDKLFSKDTIIGEKDEESELKYLKIIEDIRDKQPDLFEKIKHLPKKARAAKSFNPEFKNISQSNSLLTYFRKGRLMKFYISNENETDELDFLTAAKLLESAENEEKLPLPTEKFYCFLEKNKTAFHNNTFEDFSFSLHSKVSKNEKKFIEMLKALQNESKQFTEEQEDYLKEVLKKVQDGALPKQTVKKTLTKLEELGNDFRNPLKVMETLQKEVSPNLLKAHYSETLKLFDGKREVILSLYLSD